MRIALVGCGSIAISHARAMAASGVARCTALLDAVPGRAEALRKTFFPHAEVVSSVAEIPGKADAAIVATPAGSHAAICIELLGRGVHVLCEKPLATTLEDARAMEEAAERASRVLVCGLVRRFMSSTALVSDALQSDLLGRPRRVDVWESVTDWPLPKHAFDRVESGGGAFFDVAPHVLDLLSLWLGAVEVVAYEDDAVEGVESVARAELVCRGDYGAIPTSVVLGRGYQASNRWRIECARGTIEIGGPERDAVRLLFAPGDRVHVLKASTPAIDPFVLQLEHFVRAASGVHVSHVPVAAATRAVALVHECYGKREPLPILYAEQQSALSPVELPYRKVLVTGASGHVGARLVEIWAMRGDLGRVRCLLRSYNNAGPVLRFPADVAFADLLDRGAVRRAAEGCDAIVHLAVGDRASQEVEVLASAAKELGIRRFVHMSSAAVYGRDMPAFVERLQEETPLKRTGEPYADGKAGAERAVLRFSAALDLVILRPHIVYGPAQRWSIYAVDRVRRGVLAAVEDSGWCNLVYVDDLVAAVDRALVTTDGVGRAFFVTDGVPRHWSEFIREHGRLLDATLPRVHAADARTRGKFSWIKDTVSQAGAILASQDMKNLILSAPPIRATAVPLFRALKQFGPVGTFLARRQTTVASGQGPDPGWTSLQLSEARLSGASAEARLGYTSRVAFPEGMHRTAAWLSFFGHLDGRRAPSS
jgi:predicted dehydrogenase/nucleoside-diphosphate-sugar epimerase